MDRKEATEGLERMERERLMERSNISFIRMIPALLGASMYAGDFAPRSRPTRQGHIPKMVHNLDNSPGRAKGMKEFRFNIHLEPDQSNPDPEYIIWAGTLKAAKKKIQLLRFAGELFNTRGNKRTF